MRGVKFLGCVGVICTTCGAIAILVTTIAICSGIFSGLHVKTPNVQEPQKVP